MKRNFATLGPLSSGHLLPGPSSTGQIRPVGHCNLFFHVNAVIVSDWKTDGCKEICQVQG
ncbi:hypothetical protein Csa_011570 [Cucumis sativus]|uniref:Uncharacterized protein n=1 Tax=Cucumis sativus TaxID=3659 RepID=A0A0A0L7G8_CUCSA|nr:hypothetical protein Csa_011570 [Cucumis sativus]